jgi:hypothetical protein
MAPAPLVRRETYALSGGDSAMIPPLALDDPSENWFSFPGTSRSFTFTPQTIPRKPVQSSTTSWSIAPEFPSTNPLTTLPGPQSSASFFGDGHKDSNSIFRGESFHSDASTPSMISDRDGLDSDDEDRYHELIAREWDAWHDQHFPQPATSPVNLPLLFYVQPAPAPAPTKVLPAIPGHRAHKSDMPIRCAAPPIRRRAATTTGRNNSSPAIFPPSAATQTAPRPPPPSPSTRKNATLPRPRRPTPPHLSLYPSTNPYSAPTHRDRAKSTSALAPFNATAPLPSPTAFELELNTATLERSVFEEDDEEAKSGVRGVFMKSLRGLFGRR